MITLVHWKFVTEMVFELEWICTIAVSEHKVCSRRQLIIPRLSLFQTGVPSIYIYIYIYVCTVRYGAWLTRITGFGWRSEINLPCTRFSYFVLRISLWWPPLFWIAFHIKTTLVEYPSSLLACTAINRFGSWYRSANSPPSSPPPYSYRYCTNSGMHVRKYISFIRTITTDFPSDLYHKIA